MSGPTFWDGRSRAPLRIGVGVVVAFDLCTLAVANAHARPILAGIGVVVGLVALVQFARDRAALTSGAATLVAMAALAESDAALLGSPRRSVFASGAVLLGWLVGLAWGRALGDAKREDLAERGAIATLAATYVGAATSKLLEHGIDWADQTTLRAVLLTQRRISAHGLFANVADYVVAHPALSQLFAAATLVIQFGAVLYLVHPWLRVVWGSLLLSFHLAVLALTGIPYVGNIALLLLLSFPWPKLARHARIAEPTSTARDADVERRVLIAAIAIAVVVVALAWLLPLRAFTRRYAT